VAEFLHSSAGELSTLNPQPGCCSPRYSAQARNHIRHLGCQPSGAIFQVRRAHHGTYLGLVGL